MIWHNWGLIRVFFFFFKESLLSGCSKLRSYMKVVSSLVTLFSMMIPEQNFLHQGDLPWVALISDVWLRSLPFFRCNLIFSGLYHPLPVSWEKSQVPEHPMNLNKKEVHGHSLNLWLKFSSLILDQLPAFTSSQSS